MLNKKLTVLGKIYFHLTPFCLLRAIQIIKSFYISPFKLFEDFIQSSTSQSTQGVLTTHLKSKKISLEHNFNSKVNTGIANYAEKDVRMPHSFAVRTKPPEQLVRFHSTFLDPLHMQHRHLKSASLSLNVLRAVWIQSFPYSSQFRQI